MASALLALANATATFQLAIAGTVTDAYGNVTPSTENITVSLYLRQGTLQPTDLPGVDGVTAVFEGYAVDPQALDARIKPGIRGTLTFSGDAAETCAVVDARTPYGTTGLLGSTLSSVLGDRIRIARYGQQ
jgi:hypothetical protein